ncbi:hypothetical protein QR680_016695 [Steinernema hermaphroditum]|uniref:Folylpolyglutamate synthase n=1 Tax=Steinernema hermaphroditum TaxID=289476 RepID=A0AA39HD06_9BILA|nr:hypothetical protein QR680_016695 [Steinernema hermaphroditum]
MGSPQKAETSTLYETAVFLLNSLQSNAITVQKARMERAGGLVNYSEILPETERFMNRAGLNINSLDRLNIIHVAGTKGKGSTSAFTESILRNLGYKTGFYSSPHLVHVRERIRINGKPLSEAEFAEHFFTVYDKLRSTAKSDGDMPAYFRFLTAMAYHVFLEESVDVAIIEVGIGGEYDCTNIIKNPVACGITTLDIDHTSLLGSTLPEIAWHKAGIMKPGSTAVVVAQPPEAMKVIAQRAVEKNCKLLIAPSFDKYGWPSPQVETGIPGDHQSVNITLAMQLARVWLEKKAPAEEESLFEDADLKPCSMNSGSVAPVFEVPTAIIDALKNCEWPGRSQVIVRDGVTYYLDGAHTPISIQCCVEWFLKERERVNKLYTGVRPLRLLLFQCTADRNPETMLPHLQKCNFDYVLFTTTKLHSVVDKRSDNTNLNQSDEAQMRKIDQNRKIWSERNSEDTVFTFPCIEDALKKVEELTSNSRKVEVLVTGSLHLVGGVISFVQPDLYA